MNALSENAWPPLSPCKVCGAAAALFGVVDLSKCCEDRRRPPLPLSGVPVYYYRCPSCGLLFTTLLDGLGAADLCGLIYNDGYAGVDPDAAHARPAANAQFLIRSFPQQRPARVLDYGCGGGVLAQALRQAGFPEAAGYDPLVPAFARRPVGRFDLVAAFEVVEHCPDPHAVFADMAGLLKEDGLLLVSTVPQPDDIERVGLNWWYAAPRNGHVTLFSRKALGLVARRLGLEIGTFAGSFHVLYRAVPPWARHHFAAP